MRGRGNNVPRHLPANAPRYTAAARPGIVRISSATLVKCHVAAAPLSYLCSTAPPAPPRPAPPPRQPLPEGPARLLLLLPAAALFFAAPLAFEVQSASRASAAAMLMWWVGEAARRRAAYGEPGPVDSDANLRVRWSNAPFTRPLAFVTNCPLLPAPPPRLATFKLLALGCGRGPLAASLRQLSLGQFCALLLWPVIPVTGGLGPLGWDDHAWDCGFKAAVAALCWP